MLLLQTAVGLLATMAVVHFTITIILGVLVAFVLHLRKRSKIMKHQRQVAETTRGITYCTIIQVYNCVNRDHVCTNVLVRRVACTMYVCIQ